MILRLPAVVLFSVFLSQSFAQDTLVYPDTMRYKKRDLPRTRNNVIKTNPLALIMGNIPIYTSEARLVNETTVSLYQSVFFGASYLFKSPLFTALEQDTAINPDGIKHTVSGFRVQAGYKFYINGWMEHKRKNLKGLAPKGLYMGPHISYATCKISTAFYKSKDIYYRISFFNVNLQAGYQLIAGRFALDAFTGVGYMNNTVVYHDSNKANYPVDTSNDGYFYNSNIKIVLGVNLGLAY